MVEIAEQTFFSRITGNHIVGTREIVYSTFLVHASRSEDTECKLSIKEKTDGEDVKTEKKNRLHST